MEEVHPYTPHLSHVTSPQQQSQNLGPTMPVTTQVAPPSASTETLATKQPQPPLSQTSPSPISQSTSTHSPTLKDTPISQVRNVTIVHPNDKPSWKISPSSNAIAKGDAPAISASSSPSPTRHTSSKPKTEQTNKLPSKKKSKNHVDSTMR